jgi:hypothetical protein
MRKYYVRSGHLQAVVLAVTPEQAAMKAFRMLKEGMVISPLTCVSQRGFNFFDHEYGEDIFFNTVGVIQMLSLAGDGLDDQIFSE